MSFAELVRLFEQKAEPFIDDGSFTTIYEQSHGFLQYKIDENNNLHIGCCCCDIKWAHGFCEDKAKLYDCKEMYMFTCRNPKAFLRRGYSLGWPLHLDAAGSGYYDNGKFYWRICEVINNDV